MNAEKFLQKFLPVFVAAFLVNFIIVTIFNIFRWGTFDIYWEGPFTLAATLGVVYGLMENRKKEKNDE
ncbi:hypothetical protein ACFLSQ_00635 [Bacteroidota bacterium]